MTRDLWENDTVTWYRRAIAESGLTDQIMHELTPLLRSTDTILDLGCGPGTLSIPLARHLQSVTAVDENSAMLEGLRTELAQAHIKNVTPVQGRWPDVADQLHAHDALIAANVVPIVRDVPTFLTHARCLARRLVVIVLGAGDRSNKFFNRELREHLHLPARSERSRSDYLEQYTALHQHGVCANIRIIAYDFDQPFEDWDDAVAFHRAHLRLETHEHDSAIDAFLRSRLLDTATGPRLPMPKRSAVIWWTWDEAQATGPA